MGWSVEVHERQRLAAAARRPKRRPSKGPPRPVESGVWEVSAGEGPAGLPIYVLLRILQQRDAAATSAAQACAWRPATHQARQGGCGKLPRISPIYGCAGVKTVAMLGALLGAAAWARRDRQRQQGQATTSKTQTLLGRLSDAVSARLQVGDTACRASSI